MQGLPEGAVRVPLPRLSGLSPLGRKFWTSEVVSVADVKSALAENRLRPTPIAELDAAWDTREAHAERIAWFVVNGLGADDFLEIDVGVPALGCFIANPVQDGNHRLAAALIRGEREIWCSIAGEEREVRRRFGADVAAQMFTPSRRNFR